MKTALTLFTVIFLTTLAGCEPKAERGKPLTEKKELLTVNFQEGQTLQYKFISSRDMEVDWGPMTKRGSKTAGPDKIDKSSESMGMVVAYTPIKVDPYGSSTIKATCKSISVSRTPPEMSRTGRDAAESLAGASFTFTVEPTGKIEDHSQLEKLIKETGEKAFRPRSSEGRVKEPDMIGDFTATQWFLWDSVSSIKNPAKGVRVGQSWKSKLPVPTPMVMQAARDVNYTLDEIRQTEKGQIAVIRSTYSPAESVPANWPPMPYSGSFQMSGRFGFLRDYQIFDVNGNGEELLNIDAGRMERYNQQYQVRMGASLPLGIGPRLHVTINQNLTMELLEQSATGN